MFNSLLKAAAVVVDLPVSVAKDTVDVFTLNVKDETSTEKSLKRFTKNVENLTDPDKG